MKKDLFGVYHYKWALGEFHTQKGKKKITASYKEALNCLVRSAVSHVGDVYSLFSFLLDSPQN